MESLFESILASINEMGNMDIKNMFKKYPYHLCMNIKSSYKLDVPPKVHKILDELDYNAEETAVDNGWMYWFFDDPDYIEDEMAKVQKILGIKPIKIGDGYEISTNDITVKFVVG